MSHGYKSKLAEIRVRREVFKGVKSLSKEPKRLVLIRVISRTLVFPAEIDALLEYSAHEGLGCIPMTVLVRDIVFHSRPRIDG
jgi:hypothetical protein